MTRSVSTPPEHSRTVQAIVPERLYRWLYGQATARQQSISGYVRDLIQSTKDNHGS